MKELEKHKKKLISEFNWLLYEYGELKQYFIGTTSPEEAEMRYYSKKLSESGYLSEGLFSLNFNGSLFKEIEKNKTKRKELTKQIKELKGKIQEERNAHSLLFQRKMKIKQITKKNE